ncbi:hypothetical protein [Halobacillus sp. Marseille-Q1614]|uniref:hypothetical protein n=1 Tax=Halobacillus sp. Marseille-Q1614 TaxID=2709134 RepID=UPI00156F55B1|nr:hypothetical protein [Halobacillus sp. Marseille-Q1614]
MILDQEVTKPIEGSIVVASEAEPGSQQWDTKMEKYYVTHEQHGNLFVFKQLRSLRKDTASALI